MQVTVVFAPTIQTPQGPQHEQVFFDGGVKMVVYPDESRQGRLVLHFEDGSFATYNWLHVREVLEDPVGKVRPTSTVKLA